MGFYIKKVIMRKIFIGVSFLLVFTSCEKEVNEISPKKEYTFTIDSALTRDGRKSLYKDNNGLYHLKLDSTLNQQSHRITGRILVNGKEPFPPEKIEWESNLYWMLRRNDTIATITKTYINYFTGQFTVVQLPPLISSKDELVPTVNKASYSGTKGEINTIISPIYRMKGDTMIIKASHFDSQKKIYTKIVLE